MTEDRTPYDAGAPVDAKMVAEPTARMVGFAGLIVCAPKSMVGPAVCEWANRERPTGIESRWQVDSEFVTDAPRRC